MGRPKRSVRSARDRWAKSRRFIPNMERLLGSVRRSMCEQHFDGFQSFRDGLNEVCTLVSGADVKVEEEFSAFFPQTPTRMTQDDWRSFKLWLKTDMGEPVRHVCMSWYRYWRHIQIHCSACRGGAAVLVDSDSEEEAGASDHNN